MYRATGPKLNCLALQQQDLFRLNRAVPGAQPTALATWIMWNILLGWIVIKKWNYFARHNQTFLPWCLWYDVSIRDRHQKKLVQFFRFLPWQRCDMARNRKEGWWSLNRDEGIYTVSHTYDYQGKNIWLCRGNSFFLSPELWLQIREYKTQTWQ